MHLFCCFARHVYMCILFYRVRVYACVLVFCSAYLHVYSVVLQGIRLRSVVLQGTCTFCCFAGYTFTFCRFTGHVYTCILLRCWAILVYFVLRCILLFCRIYVYVRIVLRGIRYSVVAGHMLTCEFLFRAHVYSVVSHGTCLHVYSVVAGHMLTRVFTFQSTRLHVYFVLYGTGLHVYSVVAGHMITCVFTF